jgi:hypothetical protein
MDNFSWGNTRVVLGESGKKMVIHVSPREPLSAQPSLTLSSYAIQDEGKFDPKVIPEKSWREYEYVHVFAWCYRAKKLTYAASIDHQKRTLG